jgi:hypothetical protein
MLKHVAHIEAGTVLEIGAWHPTDKSNSRALIERGWSATLIEPSPGPMLNLMRACVECGHVPKEYYGERKPKPCEKCGGFEPEERYGYFSRVRLIQAAVGFERGLIQLDITDDAVSASEPEHLKKWAKTGGYFAQAWIPQLTLEDLLNQFGGFTVVSFDAEGISVDLCLRYLALGQRPLVMVVEHDNRLSELASVYQAVGYKTLYYNDCNVVIGL